MKADKKAADGGELVSLMEPLLIGDGSRHRAEITDLALELTQKATGFLRSLPPCRLASLAYLVRSMNCYYSNRPQARSADGSHGAYRRTEMDRRRRPQGRPCHYGGRNP